MMKITISIPTDIAERMQAAFESDDWTKIDGIALLSIKNIRDEETCKRKKNAPRKDDKGA